MKSALRFIGLFLLITAISILYCSKDQESQEKPTTSETALLSQADTVLSPEELAQDTLPAAGELTISSFGPQGDIQGQVQIKIDFPRPLVPLTTLSDARRNIILSHFMLEPHIAGSFRILGTSTVVFEPEHSLPFATHFKLTVKQGLRDEARYELTRDFSWEFQTPLPRVTIRPGNTNRPVKLDQEVTITSTIALNLESLQDRVIFKETESDKGVDYKLLEHERNPKEGQDIGMGRVAYRYILKPRRELKKNSTYMINIQPGLMTRRGNRPTEKPVIASFRTFPPFEYKLSGFCDGCGGHLVTRPYLAFSNLPKHESLPDNIAIEPATEKFPFHRYGCGDTHLGIDDYMLEPHTTYTITLGKNLLDVFGQKLENPQAISLTTGDLTPKMWGPSGYQIITPNIEPVLGLKTVNITSAFYKMLSLKPEHVLVREKLDYYYSIKKLLEKVQSDEKIIEIPLNEFNVGKRTFDLKPFLRGENYGVVAYNFRSPKVQCYNNSIQFNGLVLRTNLGIYSQFYPTTGIIKINRLTDGVPVAGTKILIYREDDLPRLEKIWDLISGTIPQKPVPCVEGFTDERGFLQLSEKQMNACTVRRISNKALNELYPPEADPDDIMYDRRRFGFAEPPRLLIIAEKEDDWTFLHTDRYGNPSIWQFGVSAEWEAELPISRGVLFSDHYIYRPGDTVKMKGISRYLLFGKLLSGKGNTYTIKVRDPRGTEKQIGKVKVSDFGTFNIDIPTEAGQTLGYYQITAESSFKGLKFYGEFRLAEFRVPEFEVSMETDKKIAVAEEAIKLNWEGKYYFGAPMAKASSSLNITRRKSYFKPKNWHDYAFGIPSYLQDRKVSLSGTYRKETIELDSRGMGEMTVRIDEDDVPYPMTYNFDVEVTDVSRQTIAANQSTVFLPDRRLIGLKLENWIVTKNDKVEVSLIVSSPEGVLISGEPLTIKLLKREYHSVKTETPDGRFTTEHNIVTKEIETKEIKSGNEPVSVSFIPEKAGSFVILAELKREPDSGTAAGTSLWVAGEDYVPWEDSGEDRLEIIMDKKEYQIGDQATAFIKSPFPEAELFITVCREKIFQQEILPIKGSAYTYTFTVTGELLPNAYVTAALFRIGDPIVPVEEEIGKHMERIGVAGFRVSLDSKYLKVKLQPDRPKARPAEEVYVNVEITQDNLEGKRSELTVMVVDEAILALTGYSPPDLVKKVYAFRGLSVRINDNRPFIITKEQLLQKGTGYGGGMLGAMADPRVRKEFLKLAYYNPSLITDANGKASFVFKTPDNLTTWRIMVVAVGENDQFGYGSEQLLVTQPFILRAIFPRFARIGDQFMSGVAITNLTEAVGKVSVNTNILGESISLVTGPAERDGVKIKPGQSKAVLFPYQADRVGQSSLSFTARFSGTYDGKNISEADALELPLTVQDLGNTETVVASGETQAQFLQKIKVDETTRKDMGGLDLQLSSTALTNIGEGAKYLVQYPYGCLEQTSSRLLALLQLKFLSEKYGFSLEAVKPVEKVIELNIRKILLLVNRDGGYKFWPSERQSSCYLSPYVAYLFKRSEQLGYDIPDDAIKKLSRYLDGILRNPCFPLSSWKSLAEYRINVLLGIFHLGRLDETYFEEYFNRRSELSYGAQIQLAYLLSQSRNWMKEARQMLQEIKNGMFITAQTAHFESPRDLPPSWMFMYSPVITTAEAIKLFLTLEPQSEYIAKFARYLLNARRNGRWRNTYENARAIDGLVEISLQKEATPPDYTAQIFLAGKEVFEQMFKGYQYEPREKMIPMAELPPGLNEITVSKEGKGTLYYTLSYTYRLKGPQPARREGFSIKRTVKNQEQDKEIVSYQDDPQREVEISAGDILEVILEFNVPQTGYHLVIDDPIPAGLEAIDASLKTTSTRYDAPSQRRRSRGRDDARGYSRAPVNHTELRDERVALFANMVRPGIYTYSYMLRATSAGRYLWPAAKISLMYEPEQFGTCAEGFIKVEE